MPSKVLPIKSVPAKNNMRVLGIDPGYERLGMAVLEKPAHGREILLYSDCFLTSKKSPHAERLLLIAEEVSMIIKKYKPDALSIESLFFNKNQKTAFLVAEARGVILSKAAEAGLIIKEFNPLQIKIGVTGYGRADKRQVISMIHKLVTIDKDIRHDDEYDAVAAGLTFFAHHR
jgi:crossover junction endodeoxyribonuclease RuvC